jgi:hypothetical protein
VQTHPSAHTAMRDAGVPCQAQLTNNTPGQSRIGPPASLAPAQVRPGTYNEDTFRGLDYVIAEAGKAGIKVILSLADNWKYHGGVDEVRAGWLPVWCGWVWKGAG